MIASDVLGIPMDKITLVQLRHRPSAARCGHDGLALAADRRAAPSTCASNEVLAEAKQLAAHLLEADRRRHRRRRRRPAGRRRAGQRAVVGRARRRRREDPSQLPDGMEPGALRHELDFDGTDSTFPFGAHVAGRRGRHRDRRRRAAAPRRGRRLRPHPQPAARRRPAARRHRPGRGAGAVRAGAVRRRRQPDHREPHRLRDAVGGRAAELRGDATPRPTARATRSAPRASASRARSARRRRSRTPSSTRCRHLGVRTSTCRAPRACGGRPGGFGLDQSGGPSPDVSASRCSHTAESAVNDA